LLEIMRVVEVLAAKDWALDQCGFAESCKPGAGID